MNKVVLVFVLILFIDQTFSQNQYLVVGTVSVDASRCDACNSWKRVNTVTLNEKTDFGVEPLVTIDFWWEDWLRLPTGDIWTNVYHTNTPLTRDVVIDDTNDLTFSFYDPISDHIKYIGYYAYPGSKEFGVSPNYHNTTGGIFYKSLWVNVDASTYDPVKISSISVNGNEEDNICVNDVNDNIDFTFNVQNPLPQSHLTLHLYTHDGEEYNEISTYSFNANGNPEPLSIPFNELGLENYWGQEVSFQIETQRRINVLFIDSIIPVSIFSGYKKVQFFKQIPVPTNETYHQKACYPKALFSLTLDNGTIQKLNEDPDSYKFRIKKENEGLSNVYRLEQYGAIEGNTITLIGGDNDNNPGSGLTFQPEDETTYNIQIYQNVHGEETPNYNEISCARVVDITLGNTPTQLALSATPTQYTFNSQTYHVSSFGASDGEVLLSVADGQTSRVARYEYFENNNWYTIPQSQLEVRDGQTWYINLSAGLYQVRAIDTDECESNPIEFPLVQPALLEITDLDSTLVTCHLNNMGQHSNGQIGIHFTGGIGPYQVEVFNESETSVYNRAVDADDFLQGDDICHINTPPSLPVGNYRVVVTDNSGTQVEENIEVISNPELILSATPIPYDCYGSIDGAILLRLENREGLAVNYGLNGDSIYRSFVDTAYFNYLTEGTYLAGVVNSIGCKDIVENIEIIQPDQININGTITQPVCYNSFDGSISTNVSGGNGAYTYKWSNDATSSNITGLNNGNYTLTVNDANGCTYEEIFSIIPPAAPSAYWPETSAVLCTGNTKTLDGGYFTAYRWLKDGTLLSTERFFTLNEAGSYSLELTNEWGCKNTETFTLELSDHPLDAVLLLQDSAIINESVEAIDVTWPVPDSIDWFFDKTVALGGSNDWSQQFSVPEEGVLNVTLRAWYGGCFSDSTKNIVIYSSDEEIEEKSFETMPLILGCKLWPNPNDGNFSLEVKLNEVSSITVFVYSLQNQAKLYVKNFQGLKKYEIPFQFNDLTTGVYLVIVKAKNEQQSIKFIIKK